MPWKRIVFLGVWGSFYAFVSPLFSKTHKAWLRETLCLSAWNRTQILHYGIKFDPREVLLIEVNLRKLVVTAIIIQNGWIQEKNVYRKKRKRKPFLGVQKRATRQKKTNKIVDPTPSTSRDEDCFDTEIELEMEEPISASRKKMKLQSSLHDSSGSFESENDIFRDKDTGF